MDPSSDAYAERMEALGLDPDDIIELDLDPDDNDGGWHQGAPRTTPDRSSVGYRGRR
jgi:hypothetical protein